MLHRRLLLEWIAIAFAGCILVLFAIRSGVTQGIDNLLYDRFAPFHATPPDDRILIVDIGERSLQNIGSWPWPREVHARTIKAIQDKRPSAMLYDILFMEPTPQDAALGAALKGSAPVFLPLLFNVPGMNGAPFDIIRPAPIIARSAAGLGTANLIIDADGQARRIEIATPTPQRIAPHLAELGYRSVTGHPSPAFTRALKSGDPVYLPINPNGSFRTVEFADVLHGEVPAAFFKGKIVLVGASAAGLSDTHPVSAASGGRMAGIEIQANLLSSLLADRFIAPAAPFWLIFASLLPTCVLMLGFWRFSPARNLLLSLAITALVLSVDIFLLVHTGIWLPPAAALAGIIFVYPLWGWRRLAAINQFLIAEVDRLGADPNLPPLPPRTHSGGDVVAEEANRLHQVIAMIRNAAREREEMLQFLSHDMRTPQAAIIALSETMPGEQITPDRIERIRRHARHTLRMADGFVQLARLNLPPRSTELVDVTDTMAQAADLIWPLAKARNVHIRQMQGSSDIWIEGEAATLVRAFTNLLDNAVQHSPAGKTVFYGVHIEQNTAVCMVRDQGPGLPPERREHPFERFGPSQPSAYGDAEGHGGAGLGLAFVHAAAQRHAGTVQYQDSAGGGACFTLYLPLSEAAANPSH